MQQAYSQPVGTTISSLACQSGPVWNKLHQPFTGTGMPKSYEVPQSINPFNYLGGLPKENAVASSPGPLKEISPLHVFLSSAGQRSPKSESLRLQGTQ